MYILVTTNSRALRALCREQKSSRQERRTFLARLETDRPENLPRVLQPRQDQAAVC